MLIGGNQEFVKLQAQYELVAKNPLLSKRYATVDLLGTLQAGGNVTGASVGHPNLDHFSPKRYMQSNCIHANDDGYDLIFAQLWDKYFAEHFEEEEEHEAAGVV